MGINTKARQLQIYQALWITKTIFTND